MAELLIVAAGVATALATAECARQFWLAISLPVLAEAGLTALAADDRASLRRMLGSGIWLAVAFALGGLAYLL